MEKEIMISSFLGADDVLIQDMENTPQSTKAKSSQSIYSVD